jgi:hypothetical protein
MRFPLLLLVPALALAAPPSSFRFVILGDRTGEAQPGVYERVWQQAAAEKPAFVAGVGDTIQGLQDGTAESEWQAIAKTLRPYRQIPFYPAPGNHDVWSALSERLFRQYTGHPLHYGFDYNEAHFTILDNSRSEQLSAEELKFLESDLEAHKAQALKFVISHRPSWLLDAGLRNPEFTLHRIAKKYGVRYVLAGHLHQMLHIDLDGISYVSVPSAGGHLRASAAYKDGWFFGYLLVEVRDGEAEIQVKELEGHQTKLNDWGLLGLIGAPKTSTAGR